MNESTHPAETVRAAHPTRYRVTPVDRPSLSTVLTTWTPYVAAVTYLLSFAPRTNRGSVAVLPVVPSAQGGWDRVPPEQEGAEPLPRHFARFSIQITDRGFVYTQVGPVVHAEVDHG